MSKYKKVKPINYEQSVIREFSSTVINRLIENCANTEDYESLMHILINMNYENFSQSEIKTIKNIVTRVLYTLLAKDDYDQLNLIIDLNLSDDFKNDLKNFLFYRATGSNIDADQLYYLLEIVNEGYARAYAVRYAIKNLDFEAVKKTLEINHHNLSSDEKSSYYSNLKGVFDIVEEIDDKTLRTKIFKTLLDFSDNVSYDKLKKLASLSSKKEFKDFCKKKGIDIECDEFTEFITHKGVEPLLNFEDSQNETILNILLSRTFVLLEGEDLEEQKDKVKQMYSSLYDLHPMSREILVYTADLINKYDDVKIVFNNYKGVYDNINNIVYCDFRSYLGFDWDEGTLIHELGHFFYYKVFSNAAMPFDTLVPPYSYEKAAMKPLEKAVELLDMDKIDIEYVSSKDYADYLINNSYIIIYSQIHHLRTDYSDFVSFNNERIECDFIPNYVLTLLYDIYFFNKDEYEFWSNNDLLPNPEDIKEWLRYDFLPQIYAELNNKLSAEAIFFVARIGDYVARSIVKGDEMLYVELIVRAMELKATHISEELVDSFEDLIQFHVDTVSPKVCKELEMSRILDMPFDDSRCDDSGCDSVILLNCMKEDIIEDSVKIVSTCMREDFFLT